MSLDLIAHIKVMFKITSKTPSLVESPQIEMSHHSAGWWDATRPFCDFCGGKNTQVWDILNPAKS